MTMLAQFAAAAGGVLPAYIEDAFSTYLYTGNNATQTITNGIDLAGKGGMIWFKPRSTATNHVVFDTVRGPTKLLVPNSGSFGEITNTVGNDLTSFNSNGFSLGPSQTSSVNVSGTTQVAWTFREQPKFFDVVTWTGTGENLTINHNLGSAPGAIIVKRTDAGGDNWIVYHRSLTTLGPADQSYLYLNTTAATQFNADYVIWAASATSFRASIRSTPSMSVAGATYVAYLFAHDAGGFGLSGNENVISCGSWEGNGSTQDISLGYEPQYILLKNVTLGYNWVVSDTMRGMNNTASNWVYANTAAAEETNTPSYLIPTATGFKVNTATPTYNASGSTYIYIAIRRGPMKVPTLGTTVYNAIARTGTGAAATVTGVGFTPDWLFTKSRSNVTGSMVADRLRGVPYLLTNNTDQETTNTAVIDGTAFSTTMDGFRLSASSTLNNWSPYTYINYLFKRAPSFFDEVCYTGTGTATTVAHNLAVAPELMLVKPRDPDGGDWIVYSNAVAIEAYLSLNKNNATINFGAPGPWNSTAPTASVFNLSGTGWGVNNSGRLFVAYLFATCAGVSKVGSYTGTGTTQAINCGFTAGARFVLIKRTDVAGDWYYWDNVRGIVAGNDPYLLMNETAAEVTSTDYVDTSASGFELSSTAPAAINASGGSYIFLAVA